MTDPSLKILARLIGRWTTEATHPALPGVVVHGSADAEWLEGESFLIMRSRVDHPQFPDMITITGFTGRDRVDGSATDANRQLTMHSFDSRGVFRVYDVSLDYEAWRFSRMAPGFSQRFTGTFRDGGATIVGKSQLCEDDVHWNDDLQITYRRRE